MSNTYKYILLYFAYVVILIFFFAGINILRNKNISFQQEILIKQAQTHFQDQVNIRAWNATYGGVYVFANNDLKPNPYLKNNTLTTFDAKTLIKINPAWMTRQLSELSNTNGFHFRITSLNPLNPINKADAFEKRALKYLNQTNKAEYYEFEEYKDFRYMGALITTKDCLPCHEHQGYKLGEIRGGISVSLETNDYQEILEYIKDRTFNLQVILALLLSSIVLLTHRQIKNNENLENEVFKKTKEIQTAKILLQEVLDTDHSFLMVADGEEIILTNKTMLDFFSVSSLEEFRKKYKHISDSFIEQDDEDCLLGYMNEEHWIEYLQREQAFREITVMMNKGETQRCFKAHTKEVIVENKKLNIIIFDDITDSLQKINSLEEKASKDVLTDLFNRGKFNEVLIQEIALSKVTLSPLSIIFLDIDHFKEVNDTYGHETGDYVLIELAHILKSIVRKSDFVGRWGGEEFVITLQSTTVEQASILAENIRVKVENYDFKNAGKQAVSLGVTQYRDDEDEKSLLKRVDEALYEAKNTGRNKFVIR